jgi:adenylate cyclase
MERRLAAILAGDVVGYSRLMAQDEAATYGELRAALDEIVTPAVAQHAGRIFKETGDGFLARFASVNEVLGAAVAIQEGFASRRLQLRVGVNLGDVIEENGDVFGDGVNIAARLEAMAEPGAIYVSGAVVRSAGAVRGLRFERIGRRRAKNIPNPVEVYAIRRGATARHWPARRRAVAAGAALLALAAVGVFGFESARRGTIADRLEPRAESAAQIEARPVVAVLPFDNLSDDPAQSYFADGLTEDIIANLARSGELLVIARNSTFTFKNRPTDVRTIGAVLGAGYIVEGSVRRSGDQLRIVAQLVDASTGAHLWSRSYDRSVDDVFAVQMDVTGHIVASLVSSVRDSEWASRMARPTGSLRSYDLVLQGRERYQHGSFEVQALLEARALFKRAVELDPDYAAAHAHFGLTHISDYVNSSTGTATPATLEVGVAEAREAIRLKPDIALGYQVLSYGLAAGGDYDSALRAGERAVELNPNDPDSLMSLAKAQVRFGAYAEAVANAERARRLHPIAPDYYAYVHGQALYAVDRHAEAEAMLANCFLHAPRERNCLRIRTAVLVRLGRVDEARRVMAQLVSVEPGFSLSGERATRRFGDSPTMERYLSDLAAAGATETAAGVWSFEQRA